MVWAAGPAKPSRKQVAKPVSKLVGRGQGSQQSNKASSSSNLVGSQVKGRNVLVVPGSMIQPSVLQRLGLVIPATRKVTLIHVAELAIQSTPFNKIPATVRVNQLKQVKKKIFAMLSLLLVNSNSSVILKQLQFLM